MKDRYRPLLHQSKRMELNDVGCISEAAVYGQVVEDFAGVQHREATRPGDGTLLRRFSQGKGYSMSDIRPGRLRWHR